MYLPPIKSAKNLKNKTVLVRCDFDVPLNKGKIKDDSRLRAALPTIDFLLKKQVKKIILIGHLGRPAGKVMPELSLAPVAKHLEKLLNSFCHSAENRNLETKIDFIKNIEILRSAQDDRKIIMLENLRFYPGEESNDKNFAKKLAGLADIYINEAFAVSHRSAASIDAIKKYLPSFAGLNLEQEIKNLAMILKKPRKPFVAIIGGAKIETKLPVIQQFLKTADYVLVGGAIANDFLLAQGIGVGESLIDKEYITEAKNILLKAKGKRQKAKLILPTDYVWHKNKILDIGDKTIKEYCALIKNAKTIVWNGPMGYFEDKKFAKGTNEIAKAIFKSKARIVMGGGDTNQILAHNSLFQIHNSKVFISTGGGAMLEFLGGKKLPGLQK